ncbi:hypothetical protein ACFQGW_06445 [Xanthomonas theicola]|uniref:hypothetical protein n=1 Tax=Xanthomonas theicola TaxID=56464 RepID=UPI0036078993
MTPLRPYLAPLRRQRLMPLLVVAQTALACAILANMLFLLWQKLGPMLVPDGLPRNELVLVDQLVSNKEAGTPRRCAPAPKRCVRSPASRRCRRRSACP